MRCRSRLARLALSGALLCAGAAACDSVLDIEEPKLRPNGGAGDSSSAGTTPEGGEGGQSNTPVGGSVTLLPEGGMGGEAGSPTPPECENDQQRCGGSEQKTPEICQNGRWTQNTDQASGDCAVLCDAGKCIECQGDERRCAVCEEGAADCSTNQPQQCDGGFWKNTGKECAQFCQVGECVTTPSCASNQTMRTTCGDESCCRSLLVPGGSFKRNYDGEMYSDGSFPAEVSEYYLDKYEVTVGRMRQFVDAFEQFKLTLKDGTGKSDHIKDDPGWDTNFPLPADKDALVAELKCPDTTWSDDGLEQNDFPMNCASFSVAYAFCIWDGGRLSSDLEWNFAASGGGEQRVYPWKAPASGPAISRAYANYNDNHTTPALDAVGLRTKGNGRWGHADLAGGVFEWCLDYSGDNPATCKDCLNTTPAVERVVRGGSYKSSDSSVMNGFHTSADPAAPRAIVGFRCARDVQ